MANGSASAGKRAGGSGRRGADGSSSGTEICLGIDGSLGGSEGGGASSDSLALVGDAATARVALSPLRRELLARLRKPGSASSLANDLDMPRQKIGYHLRVLEEAGLIGPVGTRKRRGFTERLLEAKSDALFVDPMILGPADPDAVEKQDSFAAEHLVRTAASIVREVSRMREAAAGEGSRLLTFTLEADIGFAAPKDVERFAGRLAESLAALASEFPTEPGRRIYRLIAVGHPAVSDSARSPGIN